MVGDPEAHRLAGRVPQPVGETGRPAHHHGQGSGPVSLDHHPGYPGQHPDPLRLLHRGGEQGDRLHRRAALDREQPLHRRPGKRVDAQSVDGVGGQADDLSPPQGGEHLAQVAERDGAGHPEHGAPLRATRNRGRPARSGRTSRS